LIAEDVSTLTPTIALNGETSVLKYIDMRNFHLRTYSVLEPTISTITFAAPLLPSLHLISSSIPFTSPTSFLPFSILLRLFLSLHFDIFASLLPPTSFSKFQIILCWMGVGSVDVVDVRGGLFILRCALLLL